MTCIVVIQTMISMDVVCDQSTIVCLVHQVVSFFIAA